MAYLVGLATRREIKELKRRGWNVEEPPEFFESEKDGDDKFKMVMVFVDRNLFQIMNDPNWDGHDPYWEEK